MKSYRSQRCPHKFVKRKLAWLNNATPDAIVWLEDKSTPAVDGSVLLVERSIGHMAPAPLGCTCGHKHRDVGYHAKTCGLVEPTPSSKTPDKTLAASSATKSTAKKSSKTPAASSAPKSSPKKKSSRKKVSSTSSKNKATAKKDG